MSNEDTRTLLSQQARQSTKNELAIRRKSQRERLQAFWDDCHDDLATYARECIPDHYEGTGKVFNHETAFDSFSGWDTHELVLMMAPDHATYTGSVLECGHTRDIGVSVQRPKTVTKAMEENDRESLLSEMNDGQLL
jgi:hypothetical protein